MFGRRIANSESVAINHWSQLLRSVNAVFEQNENRIVLGAPEPVSEQKIIDNCFLERCPTKQGVARAVDLRRRRARTMRLGRSTRAANCAAWSFAGKTRPPEEFSTRILLRIPSDAYETKNTTQGGVSHFMVHLNRLVNKNQLSIDFWSGVQQSKESREPKTCEGDERRLCDLDVRTRCGMFLDNCEMS